MGEFRKKKISTLIRAISQYDRKGKRQLTRGSQSEILQKLTTNLFYLSAVRFLDNNNYKQI